MTEVIEPGSRVHTDGWDGYVGLKAKGYHHRVTVLRTRSGSPVELLPRAHLVASLLKRWLLGTHQGAVSFDPLDYYLDEFTFGFNRRTSRSRGKLFERLLEQAVVSSASSWSAASDRAGGASSRHHRPEAYPSSARTDFSVGIPIDRRSTTNAVSMRDPVAHSTQIKRRESDQALVKVKLSFGGVWLQDWRRFSFKLQRCRTPTSPLFRKTANTASAPN